MPAEIVIIAGDDRYDDESKYRERIPPHELLNAAGRAGRAGQSSQGAVILIPGEIVTIQNSTISNRWWSLKNEVFSQSDQCLKIEDPLEYFLDSIQDSSKALDITQTNILYKFKAGNLSENETRKFLGNSFYAYQVAKENNSEEFKEQLDNLLIRRNELDSLSEDILWTKDISFKTGIDPILILELGNAIDKENFENILTYSVIDLIDWFFEWLQNNDSYLARLYIKPSAIIQIKKAVGLKQEVDDFNILIQKLPTLVRVLKAYVNGKSLKQINDLIPDTARPDTSPYLLKARNFVIRLVPEISFSFGLLSLVIIEKARQLKINGRDVPLTIKVLANCIREGFDSADKLLYKRNEKLALRVETHFKYRNR